MTLPLKGVEDSTSSCGFVRQDFEHIHGALCQEMMPATLALSFLDFLESCVLIGIQLSVWIMIQRLRRELSATSSTKKKKEMLPVTSSRV